MIRNASLLPPARSEAYDFDTLVIFQDNLKGHFHNCSISLSASSTPVRSPTDNYSSCAFVPFR